MAYVVAANWLARAGKEERLLELNFTRLVKREAIPELLEDRQRSFFETIDD